MPEEMVCDCVEVDDSPGHNVEVPKCVSEGDATVKLEENYS